MARQQNQNQQRQGGGNMPPRLTQPADVSYPDIAAEYEIPKPLWHALANLYPGANPNSLAMVFEYCKARSLDPLKKPVHIVPMYIEDKTTGQSAMRDVIMPGIQEMRTTAARTNAYAGQDPVVLGPMIKVPVTNAEDAPDNVNTIEVPQYAEVTVYKLVQGKRYAFTHREYFLEAVARKRSGLINEMWQKRPIGQLSKCAEAGALRKAFPEELGGEYAAEEMEGREEFATATVVNEHGASGIPEPTTVGQETAAPEAVPTGEVADVEVPEPAAQPAVAVTEVATPAERAEVKQTPKAEAKPAQQAAAEPPATGFEVNLPDGAKRVVEAEMAKRGVTMPQLLAKLGANLEIANINQALGLIKGWQ